MVSVELTAETVWPCSDRKPDIRLETGKRPPKMSERIARPKGAQPGRGMLKR